MNHIGVDYAPSDDDPMKMARNENRCIVAKLFLLGSGDMPSSERLAVIRAFVSFFDLEMAMMLLECR